MKLADLTPTEKKVLKGLSASNGKSATDVAKAAKVKYPVTRNVLTSLKRIGLAKHQGDAHYGEWLLSDFGNKMTLEGDDGRE